LGWIASLSKKDPVTTDLEMLPNGTLPKCEWADDLDMQAGTGPGRELGVGGEI